MRILVQKKQTCWFYSNLNSLLLSKYGRRVIFKYMIEFYNNLPIDKKIKFTAGPTIRCERDPAIRKFYFYRFAYDFWFHQIQHARGLSPNLHENIANYKDHKNFFDVGAWPAEQRETILYGLGIPFKSFLESKVDSCIISKRNALNPRGHLTQKSAPKEMGEYKLDNCVIIVTSKTRPISHAISGIVAPDGTYLVLDSFGQGTLFEDDWSTEEGMTKILSKYTHKGYDVIFYSTIMYVKPTNLPQFNKDVFRHSVNRTENVNSKGRKIHTGPKGGRFVVEGTRKLYVRRVVGTENVNSKGRKIHTGPKGGRFVVEGTRKIYLKK